MPPQAPILRNLFANPTAVFDESVYRNIRDSDSISQYQVFIRQHGIMDGVYGLLTSNFSINMNAQWNALNFMDNITSNFGIINQLYKVGVAVGGVAEIANPSSLGLSSKKIYTESGYLEFDVQFRVVDWKATGEPIKSAYILSSMCIPKRSEDTSSLKEWAIAFVDRLMTLISITEEEKRQILTSIQNVGSNITETLRDVVNSLASKPSEGVSKEDPGTTNGNSGTLNKLLENTINDPDFFVIATSPKPVSIWIGNYFHHNDMVITSVKSEFSKQMTEYGPLFCDFTIGLSSRKAMLIDEKNSSPLGLMHNNRGKRVLKRSISDNTKMPNSSQIADTSPFA